MACDLQFHRQMPQNSTVYTFDSLFWFYFTVLVHIQHTESLPVEAKSKHFAAKESDVSQELV